MGPVCGSCVGSGTEVGIWEKAVSDPLASLGTYSDRFLYSAPQLHPPQQCSGSCGEGFLCHNGECVGEHATHVAASVGMYGQFSERGDTFSRAGVYHVAFQYANDETEVGLDWLLGRSVIFANRSQGLLGSPHSGLPALVDWAARYDWLLLTQSSGNSPTSQATCPGWNTLCVGSYDYGAWYSRTDDSRSQFSSYINPDSVNPGLERPHLLGPGNHDGSTSSSSNSGLYLPSIQNGGFAMTHTSETFFDRRELAGTSFAAPAVLGLAVAAGRYEGLLLLPYPSIRKLVLIVGSRDANQDGAILKGDSWASSPDGEDGAGAPSGQRIKQILDNDRYVQANVSNSDFDICGLTCRETTVATVSIPAGYTLRAGLAYQSCPSGTGNELLNDFDLYVAPSSSFCNPASSTSLNNEVEILTTNCPSSTSYDIRIRIKGGDQIQYCGSSSSEPISVVWDYYYDGPVVEQ